MTSTTLIPMYILGAGGFARELYSYLEPSNFEYNGYKLIGFLDDNQSALDLFEIEHSILGTLSNETLLPNNAGLIMGINAPQLKEKFYNFYKSKGFHFINYYHPTAIIPSNASIGEGTVFCPYSILTTPHVAIGNCVSVNCHSTIGHDVSIGHYSSLSSHCDITGGVMIKENVFLGSRASIIPNMTVSENAIIGAGSVVISKVKAGTTVFGNPAMRIK